MKMNVTLPLFIQSRQKNLDHENQILVVTAKPKYDNCLQTMSIDFLILIKQLIRKVVIIHMNFMLRMNYMSRKIIPSLQIKKSSIAHNHHQILLNHKLKKVKVIHCLIRMIVKRMIENLQKDNSSSWMKRLKNNLMKIKNKNKQNLNLILTF